MNDAIWLTLCPVAILLSMPDELPIEIETFTAMTAFATASMLIKLMDWMRIFSFTSFYIYLIVQTIKRILAFLLLMTISLMTFGIPMAMLNINRRMHREKEVITDIYSYWVPNIMTN